MTTENDKKETTIEDIKQKISVLANKISNINFWIRNNPQVTDPNVYEIMECNVQYAEVFAELIKYYQEHEWPMLSDPTQNDRPRHAQIAELPKLHPELGTCFLDLCTMDLLRNLKEHPFFNTTEANAMYASVRMRGLAGTYILPEKAEDRKIKRELLCQSMSVPFYIWQVQRTAPNYQYDNQTEFDSMKDMFALYEASETECQFKDQLSGLFTVIDSNYKYRQDSKTDTAKK